MPSRNKLKKLRKQAAQQQGWLCFYCQTPMWDSCRKATLKPSATVAQAKGLRCTAEHVVARCDDGNPPEVRAAFDTASREFP